MSIKIDHPFRRQFQYTGTLMTTDIQIVASGSRSLAHDGFKVMQKGVQQLNFFDPNSELSKLNQAVDTDWVTVSDLLYRVLKLAKKLEKQSGGYFRADFESLATHPGRASGFSIHPFRKAIKLQPWTRLNLGGIGKGFLVDEAFNFLKQAGAKHILINAGGDCRAYSESYAWKVGLVNPFHPNSFFGHVALRNGALVTSGDTVRKRKEKGQSFSHFYDPKRQKFLKKPPYSTVVVEGPSAAESEVLAKSLLMGASLKIKFPFKGLGVVQETKTIREF